MNFSAFRSRLRRLCSSSSSPLFSLARSSSPIWYCRVSIRRAFSASSICRAFILRRISVKPLYLSVYASKRLSTLPKLSRYARCCSSSKSCWPSCWPWIFTRRLPSVRSWDTVTGRPPTRQTFLPSAPISRWSIRSPFSSGAAPNSSHRAGSTWENSALTNALLAPVRIRSREVRWPSTALMASMTMDLPAPVSPVRALKPGRKAISASSMMAIFSI